MNKKVFVPQMPSRYDQSIDSWVPIVDLSSAEEFGEIEVLLPPEAGRMAPEEIAAILAKKLYNIYDEDWLLAAGDPVLIGITAAFIALRLDGCLRILRWDKRRRNYDPIEVQLDIL